MASSYRLLDCGNGRKLEALGDIIVDRQATTAFWQPRTPASAWSKASALHHRSTKGGGHWEYQRPLPEQWKIQHGGLNFFVRLTPFGHIGLFPEQAEQWAWLAQNKPYLQGKIALNLFAYTGGSTLALAKSGAQVTHVDASKGVVLWASENAQINDLDTSGIRWIADDVQKFIQREQRRKTTYHAFVLDPPTYGRGPKGETWKIEEDLLPLLTALADLNPDPELILMSTHSPSMSGKVLAQLLHTVFGLPLAHCQWDEMHQPLVNDPAFSLPSGYYVRYQKQR
jgi:23S rRNA (cytosine1962-C5)-methyltransferase